MIFDDDNNTRSHPAQSLNCAIKKYERLFIALYILIFFISPPAFSQESASIVDLEGEIWIIRADSADRTVAQAGDPLYPGDTVITGKRGKAALLLSDETMIRLHNESEFVLNQAAAAAGWLTKTKQNLRSSYKLLKGELWFRNKRRGADISVDTQHVSISVRGTEFAVVASETQTLVNMLEGKVLANNAYGSVEGVSGEQIIAEEGKAPVKRILLNPDNAVQWVVRIPQLFDSHHAAEILRETSLDRTKAQVVLDAIADSNFPLAISVLEENLYGGALKSNQTSGSVAHPIEDMPIQHGNHHTALAGLLAWLKLEVDEHEAALQILTKGKATNNNDKFQHQLLSLIYLTKNQTGKALSHAQQALNIDSGDTASHLLLSYAEQSSMHLDFALNAALKAVEANEQSEAAWLQVARLSIGQGNFDQAIRYLDLASNSLSQWTNDMRTLAGFAYLAKNQISRASMEFDRVNQPNTSADWLVGKALIDLRQGNATLALKRISEAVTLEPLEANYMNYHGRILYELGRLDRAEEVLQRSREVDPNDPTPLYLLAIIARDRNTEGAAISLLQQAERLSDKRAVYRSRYIIDTDRAIKNVDLSLAYQKFGFNDWARQKATSALALDRGNYSAHLLYAGSFNEQPGRDTQFASAQLQARVLQPANANTFSTFRNYTNLFDVPTLGARAAYGVGSYDIEESSLQLYGASHAMNLAFQGGIDYARSDGWRGLEDEFALSKALIIKWEPTGKNSFLLTYNDFEVEQFNTLNKRFEFDFPSSQERLDRRKNQLHRFEIAHVYRPNLNSSWTNYLSYLDFTLDENDSSIIDIAAGVYTDEPTKIAVDQHAWVSQHQYYAKGKNLQWTAGIFSLDIDSNRQDGNALVLVDATGTQDFTTAFGIDNFDFSQNSLQYVRTAYIHGEGKLGKTLTIDGALYFDNFRTQAAFSDDKRNASELNPRLGIVYRPFAGHTLRAAGFRYLFTLVPGRLDPIEVAGLPVLRGSYPGAINEEYNIAYEFERNQGFLQLLWSNAKSSLETFDLINLTNNVGAGIGIESERQVIMQRRDGGEATLNQLVSPNFGVAVNYSYYDIEDSPILDTTRYEEQASLKTTAVIPNGITFTIENLYRHMRFKDRPANPDQDYMLTNLLLSHQTLNNRIELQLELNNVFDKNVNWVTDRFVIDGRIPDRNWRARLSIDL